MKSSIFFTLCFVLTSGALLRAQDSEYLSMSRAMELFGSAFRELNLNYVDQVESESLVREGLGAMVRRLDPYTSLVEPDATEETDILTSGRYVGFGMSVDVVDSQLTVIDLHPGYPAEQVLKIGDVLVSIDTVFVQNRSPEGIRTLVRGTAGTKARARVLRYGGTDTVEVVLTRTEIDVNTLGFSTMLHNGIGYTKLERFTRHSARQIRKALREFRQTDSLRAFVLDLRDNPGGLLDAAVDIAGLFLPVGTIVAETKGRGPKSSRVYRTNDEPIEPSIPLVILLNHRSASASEVLAGALQDLDRAYIVGTRSFGKGLVQSMFPLPFGYYLKTTVSKYYLPSGRLIQEAVYDSSAFVRRDSTLVDPRTYRTLGGRPVQPKHGIDPDTTIEPMQTSSLIREISRNRLDFLFVSALFARGYDTSFVRARDLDRFVSDLLERNIWVDSSVKQTYEKLKAIDSDQAVPVNTRKSVAKAMEVLRSKNRQALTLRTSELRSILDAQLQRRRLGWAERERFDVDRDNVLQSALTVFPRIETALTGLPAPGN